jgi:hypothetical protein
MEEVLMHWVGRLISLACLLGAAMFPSTTLAHRLDEYLQATLVSIKPGEVRLQINLTPGVAVAERVLGLIDRDHNDIIATNEAAHYCELLKHDLVVRLDQRRLNLNVTSSYFPEVIELRSGWGIVQLEFSASVGQLTAGAHTLTFKNRHLPSSSVYLLNATQPESSSVHILKQERNKTQSAGKVEFTIDNTINSVR